MYYVHGDLIELALDGEFDVIGQGNNCFCTMGSGIAVLFKLHFPEVYALDCSTVKGNREKLGTIGSVYYEDYDLTVLNCYTQFTFWDPKDMFSLDAFKQVLMNIKQQYPNKVIGIPLIGAGLACGNWADIEQAIFDAKLEEVGIDLYVVVKFYKDWKNIVLPVYKGKLVEYIVKAPLR